MATAPTASTAPIQTWGGFTPRRIATNVGALISGAVLARGIAAIAVILLARQVGPTVFGQYAASMTLAKVSSVLFTLGLDTWLLRNSGRTGAPGSTIASASATSLAIKLGLGSLWMLMLTLLAPLLNSPTFPQSIVALCALIVWLDELAATAWAAFQAKLSNSTTSLLMIVHQSLMLGGTLVLVGMNVQDLSAFLAMRAAAAALGCVLALAWLVWKIGFRLSASNVRPTLHATLPFAASAALAGIYGSADIIMIGLWLNSTAAGVYAPAATVVSMLFLVPAGVYGVMLPVLSQIHAQSHALLKQLTRRVIVGHLLLGLIMGGTLALLAQPLVTFVFGSAYADTTQLLMILSLVLGLHCVSFGLAAVLSAVGWQPQRVVVQAIAAVINVSLNLLVIETFGVMGVAWAYVLSDVVLVVGGYFFVQIWQRNQDLTESHN